MTQKEVSERLSETTNKPPPANSKISVSDVAIHGNGSAMVSRDNFIYVEFETDDPENPANFSKKRKWVITVCATAFTGLTSMSIGSVEIGDDSMARDLNASGLQIAATLSVYALGFGVVPLISASFSEEFGRRPLYSVTAFINFAMAIALALAPNIQSAIAIRFIAGGASSTGATMVGGTVADIWATHERGFPMALFAYSAVGSTGLGPALAGYIALNPHLEWRWIQWITAIVTGIYFVSVWFIMVETRGEDR